ncbi:MAG: serine/threonine-protein kinase [Polyangiaceae bacterium]
MREIAQGGWGLCQRRCTVRRGFERRVAIKRVHSHLSGQARFIEAFRREAELSARLAHPNIVLVLDFGRVGAAYYLAMELVDGAPLAMLMAAHEGPERRLPLSLIGFIGREILMGLYHAHEVARGADGGPLRVVHRDVCPQNVLVSRNGEVKLSDFGVARAMREGAAAFTSSTAGHVAYMAPEQARGAPTSVRADLFPVGVILWELCAGKRLFLRDNEPATLLALTSAEVPRASESRGELPREWDAFLARALSREPERRFGSAREMAEALFDLPGARGELCAAELGSLVEEMLSSPEERRVRADDVATVELSSGRG